MKKYRFHLLALPHLPQSKKYLSCAFTQKNRKLAKMLSSLGHTVFFYGPEGSDIVEYCGSDNIKFIQTHTLKDIRQDYGDGDNRFEIGYDWTNEDFRHDINKDKVFSTKKFYQVCIDHINKVKKPDDFLLCTQGIYHKPVIDAVKLYLTCESGIGYRGSIKGGFRAFESAYIQNYTYGYEGQLQCINGSYYDRVIPNYFDSDDFTFSGRKEDYYLFIGRIIKRKGVITAAMACNAIGKKLIIVGQGGRVDEQGYLSDFGPKEFRLAPGTWEYQGFADIETRKELMAHAIATFVPTEYLEIFGGVHVESMLSGTPPITTNFGVFPGTIPDYLDGKVGFKCNTLQDFVDAAIKAEKVDHKEVRLYANRFLIDVVKYDYQEWFDDLYNLYESTSIPGAKGWSRVII